jgi:AcrR family transcriptional regulator
MAIRSTQSAVRVRQERARENARREILLAAASVFARRGYAAATLADLAQAAGYAAPSLYRYFESKEEIYRSLLELMRHDLAATFDAPVDRARPLAERLAALLQAQQELAASRQEVFAVLLRDRPPEVPGKPPVPDHLAGQAFYRERMLAWLRRHVGPRELRFSFEDAAVALTGVASAFHHALHASGQGPAAARVHLIVDLVLNGLTAKPAPGPPAARRSHTP